MSESIIDLKPLPEPEWNSQVGTAFAALSSGDTLIVLTPNDPRKLIRQLVADQWGQFFWAPLSAGGNEWRSQISKRDRQGPIGILEMLGEDHRRCDNLFAAAETAADSGDQDKTVELFSCLELGMERHFSMEEEGFFPEVNQRMGFNGGGPVAVMLEEHQQMRGMLLRMAGALEEANLDDYLAASETMLFLMEQHNMKEEQMLYPMAEDAFSADMEELLQRLFLF